MLATSLEQRDRAKLFVSIASPRPSSARIIVVAMEVLGVMSDADEDPMESLLSIHEEQRQASH